MGPSEKSRRAALLRRRSTARPPHFWEAWAEIFDILASQSRGENLLWGPLALILAVFCVTVARSTAEGTAGRVGS